MIFLEAGMVAVLAALFVNTSSSDLKSGRISNKSILVALGVTLPLAVLYYGMFATDCLPAFGVNAGICIFIGLLLYVMGIWGAGDTKLFSAAILLIPARLYCLTGRSIGACFTLLAIIFIIAFVYVFIDTIFLGIRERNLLEINKGGFHWKGYFKGFLFFFFLLSLLNAGLNLVLPESVLQDRTLLVAIHFILILVGMELEKKANPVIILMMGVVWGLSFVFGAVQFSFKSINIWMYLVAVGLLLFRLIAEKYNYRTIPVTELKPGMILSFGSVFAFSQSQVKGLPLYTTEDLKSRLTEEEVGCIRRWSESKQGQKMITIVRKIPFALFISIGTVIFLVLEVSLS